MSHLQARRTNWRGALATSVLLSVGCVTGSATWAQTGAATSDSRPQVYNIGAQALGAALQEFARQAGIQLMFSEADVEAMRTGGLHGRFMSDQALQRLLTGSGLAFEFPNRDAVIIRRPGNSPDSVAAPAPAPAPTPPPAPAGRSAATSNPTLGAGPRIANDPRTAGTQSESVADYQE